jgi:hypothetical protein
MELTVITGLPESTGAHGVGTADGAAGNNNAKVRGHPAPAFLTCDPVPTFDKHVRSRGDRIMTNKADHAGRASGFGC